jgi:hypothetical protein
MHYKETMVWDKHGTFSGSGIGIGTGGVGVGMGGGSYHEEGEAATKRAKTFSEPEPIHLPFFRVILFGIAIAVALRSIPTMIGIVLAFAGEDPSGHIDGMKSLLDLMSNYVGYATLPLGLLVLWNSWRQAQANKREEDRLNSTVYQAQLARYNQLQYCEGCHSLFDNSGNVRNANPLGFAQMMELFSK